MKLEAAAAKKKDKLTRHELMLREVAMNPKSHHVRRKPKTKKPKPAPEPASAAKPEPKPEPEKKPEPVKALEP